MVETIKKGRLAHVRLGLIVPGRNPREYFDDAKQEEIDASVQQKGVMTPVLLRCIEDGQYQLIAGERRYRAAKKAFDDDYEMPASIFDLDDVESAMAALTENLVRDAMSPAEEARAASQLLAAFAGDRDEVTRRMGFTHRSVLDKRLALMNCSDLVLSALTRQKIWLGHAELLAAAPKAAQDKALGKLLGGPKLMSVADLKAQLASIARPLASACFDKTDCLACPHNSDTQQAMFSEAIEAGNCTSGDCYTQKTEAVLLERKAGLVDIYPRVEIMRPGENYSVIKLVVEGERGVGSEQAEACKGCANFGAAISGVPGKEGKVYEGQCFDTPCNTRMVARQLRATAAAAAAEGGSEQAPAEKGAAGKPKQAPSAETATKKAAATAVSAGVVTFRKQVWRTALKTDLQSSPRKCVEMLIAICLAGSVRNVVSEGIDKTKVAGLTGTSILHDLQALSRAEGGHVTQTVAGVACTALDALSDTQITDALKAYSVDLAKTFAIDAAYLTLLTKSEIGAIAKEVGLEKAFGSGFSKLMGGKKDDAIKALLAIPDFNYHVIPGQLAIK